MVVFVSKTTYGFSTKNGERRCLWEDFPIIYNCIDLNRQTYTSLKDLTLPGRSKTKTPYKNIDKMH